MPAQENLSVAESDDVDEISNEAAIGMRFSPGFSPDAVILSANLPQLDWCDLRSEIAGSNRTQNICAIMMLRARSRGKLPASDGSVD